MYKFDSHLRDLRAFINAGGGTWRRALFTEWALSLSRVDYADTRWDSLVMSVCYTMGTQSSYEIAKADRKLKKKALGGDPHAAAAMEVTLPQPRWAAIYEVIESIPAAPSGSGDVNTLQDSILAYNSDIGNFAAFKLMSKVLDTVPAVFKLVQGSSKWEAKLRSATGSLPTAVSAATELISSIELLESSAFSEAWITETIEESRAYRETIKARLLANGELSIEAVPAFDLQGIADLAAAKTKLTEALSKAVTEFTSCAAKVSNVCCNSMSDSEYI